MSIIFDPRCKLVVYVGSEKYTIEDLHMEFNILLTSESDPNTAEITIYNLSQNTRALFGERHQPIEFYAGYGEDCRLIFMGTTDEVESHRESADWITKIVAGEGQKEFVEKHFSKTYQAGTTIKTIIQDLCIETGFPFRITDYLLFDRITQSETYFGKVKTCLDKICDSIQHEWSVIHGVIEVRPVGEPMFVTDFPTAQETIAFILNSETGMLNTPSIIYRDGVEPILTDKEKKAKAKSEKNLTDDEKDAKREKERADRMRTGTSVQCALNSDLRPGALIQIELIKEVQIAIEAYDGTVEIYNAREKANLELKSYIIDTVNFFGDNFGGDFIAEVKADIPKEDEETLKRALRQ